MVGRLSALQGDCASAEVHRRMSETYGEREGTYRMTNMVLQSQASWGAIERVKKGKRIKRAKPIVISNEQAVSWLGEAALRYIGTLSSLAVLYPFVLDQPLGYLASISQHLEVYSQGSDSHVVSLKASV